jgi:hypothetical protein
VIATPSGKAAWGLFFFLFCINKWPIHPLFPGPHKYTPFCSKGLSLVDQERSPQPIQQEKNC